MWVYDAWAGGGDVYLLADVAPGLASGFDLAQPAALTPLRQSLFALMGDGALVSFPLALDAACASMATLRATPQVDRLVWLWVWGWRYWAAPAPGTARPALCYPAHPTARCARGHPPPLACTGW